MTSRKGTVLHDGETKAVYARVQIQSRAGKLAARYDHGRGVSEVRGLLFDGEPVASGVPAEGTRAVRRSARSQESKNGTGVRGCFALRHRTRQVLLIAFDDHMRADLVTDAIETMAFEVPSSTWQSEEAHTLWGGPDPLLALAQRRMSLSMSQAGMPTDIGMRNALSASSSWLEFHVAPILRWGDILRAAETRDQLV
jgi:transposase InsO family protein